MAGNDDGFGAQPGGQPPARRPGEGVPASGEPGARPPEAAGPKPKTSVLRQPTITIEPASIKASPGATSELTLSITNNSDTVDEFSVELDDRSVGWVRFAPASKNIWPGARDSIRILVEPPRSADVRAGLKRYGLTIRGAAIPGGATSASIEIEVLPFEAIDARLVPRTSSGFRRGRHRVEVGNQGSAPWTASISATDPQEDLRFDVVPAVTIGPAETANIRVVARPKPWNIVGSTVNRPFTVTLVGSGGDQQRLDASMDQLPFIPQKLVVPFIAAAALIVVGILWVAGFIPFPPPGPTPAPSTPAAVVTSAPTTTPVESEGPTATPVESEPPSEPPSAEPTEAPSETPPPGVASWAWDRRNALLAAQSPFDPGAAVGTTQPTNDGKAEVQLWDNATMYRMLGATDVPVIRPPILDKFREITSDVKAPAIGYPLGNRRNDGGERYAQQFTEGAITCLQGACFVLSSELYDAWFPLRTTVGYPTTEVVSFSDPTEASVAKVENGWVIYDFGSSTSAVCDANRNLLAGPSADLCQLPQ
jgi:hypothetical protein